MLNEDCHISEDKSAVLTNIMIEKGLSDTFCFVCKMFFEASGLFACGFYH